MNFTTKYNYAAGLHKGTDYDVIQYVNKTPVDLGVKDFITAQDKVDELKNRKPKVNYDKLNELFKDVKVHGATHRRYRDRLAKFQSGLQKEMVDNWDNKQYLATLPGRIKQFENQLTRDMRSAENRYSRNKDIYKQYTDKGVGNDYYFHGNAVPYYKTFVNGRVKVIRADSKEADDLIKSGAKMQTLTRNEFSDFHDQKFDAMKGGDITLNSDVTTYADAVGKIQKYFKDVGSTEQALANAFPSFNANSAQFGGTKTINHMVQATRKKWGDNKNQLDEVRAAILNSVDPQIMSGLGQGFWRNKTNQFTFLTENGKRVHIQNTKGLQKYFIEEGGKYKEVKRNAQWKPTRKTSREIKNSFADYIAEQVNHIVDSKMEHTEDASASASITGNSYDISKTDYASGREDKKKDNIGYILRGFRGNGDKIDMAKFIGDAKLGIYGQGTILDIPQNELVKGTMSNSRLMTALRTDQMTLFDQDVSGFKDEKDIGMSMREVSENMHLDKSQGIVYNRYVIPGGPNGYKEITDQKMLANIKKMEQVNALRRSNNPEHQRKAQEIARTIPPNLPKFRKQKMATVSGFLPVSEDSKMITKWIDKGKRKSVYRKSSVTQDKLKRLQKTHPNLIEYDDNKNPVGLKSGYTLINVRLKAPMKATEASMNEGDQRKRYNKTLNNGVIEQGYATGGKLPFNQDNRPVFYPLNLNDID